MDLSGLMLVPMGLNTSLCGEVNFDEDITEENNVRHTVEQLLLLKIICVVRNYFKTLVADSS